jgi:hypothetical protein
MLIYYHDKITDNRCMGTPSVSMEFHRSLTPFYIKERNKDEIEAPTGKQPRRNKDRQQQQPEQERAHHLTRQRSTSTSLGMERDTGKQGQPANHVVAFRVAAAPGWRRPWAARARMSARARRRSPARDSACLPLADAALACVRDRGQRHRNSKPERLPFGVASRHRNPQTQRPLPPLPFPTAAWHAVSTVIIPRKKGHNNQTLNSAAYYARER